MCGNVWHTLLMSSLSPLKAKMPHSPSLELLPCDILISPGKYPLPQYSPGAELCDSHFTMKLIFSVFSEGLRNREPISCHVDFLGEVGILFRRIITHCTIRGQDLFFSFFLFSCLTALYLPLMKRYFGIQLHPTQPEGYNVKTCGTLLVIE